MVDLLEGRYIYSSSVSLATNKKYVWRCATTPKYHVPAIFQFLLTYHFFLSIDKTVQTPKVLFRTGSLVLYIKVPCIM